MVESKQHQRLVEQMAFWLHTNCICNFDIRVHIQDKPGDPIPPKVSSHRPDLYASSEKRLIIGEAKTGYDIDRKHSIEQYKSFLAHLEKIKGNYFVLAVPYEFLDKAKFTLDKLQNDMELKTANIAIFDECDIWSMDKEYRKWHLF